VTADGIIVSGSLDGTIQLWDRTRPGGWGLELGRHGAVMDLTVVSDRYVASVGINGSIRLWDTRQPPRGYSEMIADNAVRSVTSTIDGYVIYGCGDGSLGLWNPAASGSQGLTLGAHRGAVGALAADLDGNLFVANHHLITAFTLVSA
jgi:WD40 repeat protein